MASKLTLGLALASLITAACAPRYAVHDSPAPPLPALPEPEPFFYLEPIPEPELPTPEVSEQLSGVLAGVDLAAFDMPIHVNEHVLGYIDVFTGRARGRFEQWLERQGIYAPLIEERIAARGVPRELIYLALIESGFSPVAVSHASAVGLWQFMAATGRMEGLEITEFLDERRDPVRATDAALQHLERLYDRFGSWYLAAAAYNAGSGRIERALSAGVDGRRGNDSIFWEIRHLLPTETRNYVPQLIAASIIGSHRNLFGFGHVMPADPLAYEVATIPDATELTVIAEAAAVDRRTIVDLNPHFIRDMTPPGRRVEVRLPVGTADAFRVAYAAIPADERVRTRVHVVASGETLSGIASRYRTTVAAIQTANRIDRPDRIAAGRRLIIPTSSSAALAAARASAAPAAASSAAGSSGASSGASNGAAPRAEANGTAAATTRTANPAGDAATYAVRSGDTLSGIARRHGISLQQLTALNGLDQRSVIRPGQTLRVRAATTYLVRPGDTLSGIAQRHGVSSRELRSWNGLTTDLIRPGDRLEVRQ